MRPSLHLAIVLFLFFRLHPFPFTLTTAYLRINLLLSPASFSSLFSPFPFPLLSPFLPLSHPLPPFSLSPTLFPLPPSLSPSSPFLPLSHPLPPSSLLSTLSPTLFPHPPSLPPSSISPTLFHLSHSLPHPLCLFVPVRSVPPPPLSLPCTQFACDSVLATACREIMLLDPFDSDPSVMMMGRGGD